MKSVKLYLLTLCLLGTALVSEARQAVQGTAGRAQQLDNSLRQFLSKVQNDPQFFVNDVTADDYVAKRRAEYLELRQTVPRRADRIKNDIMKAFAQAEAKYDAPLKEPVKAAVDEVLQDAHVKEYEKYTKSASDREARMRAKRKRMSDSANKDIEKSKAKRELKADLARLAEEAKEATGAGGKHDPQAYTVSGRTGSSSRSAESDPKTFESFGSASTPSALPSSYQTDPGH